MALSNFAVCYDSQHIGFPEQGHDTEKECYRTTCYRLTTLCQIFHLFQDKGSVMENSIILKVHIILNHESVMVSFISYVHRCQTQHMLSS